MFLWSWFSPYFCNNRRAVHWHTVIAKNSATISCFRLACLVYCVMTSFKRSVKMIIAFLEVFLWLWFQVDITHSTRSLFSSFSVSSRRSSGASKTQSLWLKRDYYVIICKIRIWFSDGNLYNEMANGIWRIPVGVGLWSKREFHNACCSRNFGSFHFLIYRRKS